MLQTMRSGGTQHPEEIMNFLASQLLVSSGVMARADGGLLVVQQTVPDMTVKVAAGYALIKKTEMAYPVRNTTAANVTIGANSSGNPRKDAIVLYIDLGVSPISDVSNVAKLVAVQGTPAASPSAPDDAAIQTSIGAANPFIRLADVTVASGAVSILTANILDQRFDAKFNQTVKALNVEAIPAADLDYSGITQVLQAGEALAFGNIVYLKSDGKVWKADADAESTAPAMAMALGTISANAYGLFLLIGTARNDAWNWTVGGKLYMDTTAGAITQSQPSATDDVIQVIGIATHADRIFFNPVLTYITHL